MTMHKPYFEWMQLALDGELLATQQRELDAHLAECAECATRREALARVAAIFSGAPVVAPRPGFTGRFNARLKQRRSQPRPLWGVFALGLGVAGGAMLILPLGLGMVWTLAQVIGQPATTAAMFNSATAASNLAATLAGAFTAIARSLGEYALGSPVAWAGGGAAIVIVAAWFYLMRRLALQGLMS
jgi:anti-sigma factor RsiW